jgi:hypothetical protein
MTDVDVSSGAEPSHPLTWQEICHRYPGQWVALVEIIWVDDDEVATARVAGHGPRRADPLRQARHLHSRYEEIGHFFTGRIRAPRVGFFQARVGGLGVRSPRLGVQRGEIGRDQGR